MIGNEKRISSGMKREITNPAMLSLSKKDIDWLLKLNDAAGLLYVNDILTQAEREKVSQRIVKKRNQMAKESKKK